MLIKPAMRSKTLLPVIILLFSFIFSRYTLYGQPIAKEDSREFRINPINAHGGKFSEIFEQANYIPLETTKESIFGEIGKLEVTDRYFIILDKDANKIMIFEKGGKFHAKINLSPLHSGRFTIDRAKNEIVVFVSLNNLIEVRSYDYDGTLLTNSKVNFFYNDFIIMGSSFVTYMDRPKKILKDTGWNYSLFYSKDLNSFSKKLMPLPINYRPEDYPDINYYYNGNFFGNDNSYMFTKSFDYNAYELDSNGVHRQYKFIFPLEYTFIIDSTLRSGTQGKQRNQANTSSSNKIIALNNFYKSNNYLLFDVSYNHEPNSLLFNMLTQELISYRRVTSDSLSYFLPIYNVFNNIQACYHTNIYTSFSSLEMFDVNRETSSKNPKYNPVLLRYFTKGSKKDNPVIVEIGLKHDLYPGKFQ